MINKILSSVLIASLVVLSPGLECSRALAETINIDGPAGIGLDAMTEAPGGEGGHIGVEPILGQGMLLNSGAGISDGAAEAILNKGSEVEAVAPSDLSIIERNKENLVHSETNQNTIMPGGSLGQEHSTAKLPVAGSAARVANQMTGTLKLNGSAEDKDTLDGAVDGSGASAESAAADGPGVATVVTAAPTSAPQDLKPAAPASSEQAAKDLASRILNSGEWEALKSLYRDRLHRVAAGVVDSISDPVAKSDAQWFTEHLRSTLEDLQPQFAGDDGLMYMKIPDATYQVLRTAKDRSKLIAGLSDMMDLMTIGDVSTDALLAPDDGVSPIFAVWNSFKERLDVRLRDMRWDELPQENRLAAGSTALETQILDAQDETLAALPGLPEGVQDNLKQWIDATRRGMKAAWLNSNGDHTIAEAFLPQVDKVIQTNEDTNHELNILVMEAENGGPSDKTLPELTAALRSLADQVFAPAPEAVPAPVPVPTPTANLFPTYSRLFLANVSLVVGAVILGISGILAHVYGVSVVPFIPAVSFASMLAIACFGAGTVPFNDEAIGQAFMTAVVGFFLGLVMVGVYLYLGATAPHVVAGLSSVKLALSNMAPVAAMAIGAASQNSTGSKQPTEESVAAYFQGLTDLMNQAHETQTPIISLDSQWLGGPQSPEQKTFTKAMGLMDEATIRDYEARYTRKKGLLTNLLDKFELYEKSNANIIAFINSDEDLQKRNADQVSQFKDFISYWIVNESLADDVPLDRNELNFWLNKYPSYLHGAETNVEQQFRQDLSYMDEIDNAVNQWEQQVDKPGAIGRFFETTKNISAIALRYGMDGAPTGENKYYPMWIFQARHGKRFLDAIAQRPELVKDLQLDGNDIFQALYNSNMFIIEDASPARLGFINSTKSPDEALKFNSSTVGRAFPKDSGLDHFLALKPNISQLAAWFLSYLPIYAVPEPGSYYLDGNEYKFSANDKSMDMVRNYLSSPADRQAFITEASRYLIDLGQPILQVSQDTVSPYLDEQIRSLKIVGPVPIEIEAQMKGWNSIETDWHKWKGDY